jgi:micrococcal nuclease
MPMNLRAFSQPGLAAALLAVAVFGAAAAEAPLTGIVVRVIDGDSLLLRPPGGAKPVEVRLQDIDAPEICQAGGAEAKKALEDLVLTQTAVLRASARDSYGRTVGRLMVGDIDVGRRQVEDGHAWSAQGRNGRGPLMKQERMAKALNRGLWLGGRAVNPKDFRRAHGPCTVGR